MLFPGYAFRVPSLRPVPLLDPSLVNELLRVRQRHETVPHVAPLQVRNHRFRSQLKVLGRGVPDLTEV